MTVGKPGRLQGQFFPLHLPSHSLRNKVKSRSRYNSRLLIGLMQAKARKSSTLDFQMQDTLLICLSSIASVLLQAVGKGYQHGLRLSQVSSHA